MTMFSHVGVCVDDLDKAAAFYSGAFGFTESYGGTAGNEFAGLLGMSNLDLELKMMQLDGRKIELLHHRDPQAHPRPSTPYNTLGFTHLAFYVDDIDAATELVREFGGTVLDDQRLELETPTETRIYQFCLDPSGNRVELIKGSVRG